MAMTYEDFRLTTEGEPERVIRGRVTRPSGVSGDRPGVLVLHGFKGFFRWGFFPELQRRLAENGLIAVAFNLSGSGVGEDLENFTEDAAFERSTPSRDLEDVERVRAWIDAGGVPGLAPDRLGLFGHSRGAATVLLHAGRRADYRAVVTWAAAAKTMRFAPDIVDKWREFGVLEIPNARTGQIHRVGLGWLDDVERNAAALDVSAACRRLATPVLLVHGTADESVPFAESELLLDACGPEHARLVPVEGAGHTFGAVHPFRGTTPALELALAETRDFLAAHLG